MRISVIHWQDGKELEERAQRIAALGYTVDARHLDGGAFYRRLKKDPPAALVIDLAREPERGYELACLLRSRQSTAALALIFVNGFSDTLTRIRSEIPDACFSSWEEIDAGIRAALKLPIPLHAARETSAIVGAPAGTTCPHETSSTQLEPVREGPAESASSPPRTLRQHPRFQSRCAAPEGGSSEAARIDEAPSSEAASSQSGLASKLGIRAGKRLALLAAPRGFAGKLGKLPANVTLRNSARGKSEVLVLFCKDSSVLEKRLPSAVRALSADGILWIARPRTSPESSKQPEPPSKKLSFELLQERAQAQGLIEARSCNLDEDWSAVSFTR